MPWVVSCIDVVAVNVKHTARVMQLIVIGHKNPDMDSICSAVGYARLKQLLGVPDVIPARAGNTNARIDFVLQKFGVEAPVFLSDVSPGLAM